MIIKGLACNKVFSLDSDLTNSKAFEFYMLAPIVLKLSTPLLHVLVHLHTKFHPSTRPRSRATHV